MEIFPLQLSMFDKDMFWEMCITFGNFNRENAHIFFPYGWLSTWPPIELVGSSIVNQHN
jgi:hypothetical protein